MPRMTQYSFDHLHLRSLDPEAAAAFYVSAFGATIKARVTIGGKLRLVLDLTGLPFFIEEVPAGTGAPPAPPFLGLEHIGLTVSDMDAAVADLTAKGVALLDGPREARPGVRIAFFAAPDGARVELIERKG